MRTITVKADERLADLWARTLLLATHDRSTTTAADLLHRMLARERRALAARKGPGWIGSIEARFYKQKPAHQWTAPPPGPVSYVD